MTTGNLSDSATIEMDRTKYLTGCAKMLVQLLGEAHGRGTTLPPLDDLAKMGVDMGLDAEDARACLDIATRRYRPILRGFGYAV